MTSPQHGGRLRTNRLNTSLFLPWSKVPSRGVWAVPGSVLVRLYWSPGGHRVAPAKTTFTNLTLDCFPSLYHRPVPWKSGRVSTARSSHCSEQLCRLICTIKELGSSSRQVLRLSESMTSNEGIISITSLFCGQTVSDDDWLCNYFPNDHKITIIYLYGSTALVEPYRYFSFLIHTQSVELLGRGISPSKAVIYTQNNTNTE
jgi:hypothetical protein